jgi:hypothetical protein
MIAFLRVGFLLLCCSFTLIAKEQHLVLDGDIDIYELTFDDTRISAAAMQEIWWFSPWVDSPPKGPFEIARAEWKSPIGDIIVDKTFYAPELELCVIKPDANCNPNPEVPDAAFLENAARNLKTGDEQVGKLQKDKLPSVLEPVRVYLLLHLKISIEREKARYEFLKSGDLTPMQRILCGECSCSAEQEVLLKQLKTTIEDRQKLRLTRKWHNEALKCEAKTYPPAYPMAAWKQFINDFGIKEQRRYKQIDEEPSVLFRPL